MAGKDEEIKVVISADPQQLKPGLKEADNNVNLTVTSIVAALNSMTSRLESSFSQVSGSIDKSTETISKSMEKMSSSIDKETKKAADDAKRLSDAMSGLGEKIQTVGEKMSIGITAPMTAGSFAIAKAGIDAVESENLFEVSFDGMAKSAREWSEDLRQDLGLNGYELRKNSALLYTMFESLQLTKTAAFDMSTGLTKLSYDMASFYNIKPEVAFEKLKSGITGETEPLKALGINLLDTQVEAYALRTGLIKLGEELSEQGKIAARYGLIMESTQKAQGDLARTMDSPTNKLRIQKAQFEEVSTSLAFSLMPQIEKAIGLYKDFGEGVVSVVKGFQSLDESQQNVILSLGGVAAATGPVILGLAGVAKAVLFVKQTYEELRVVMAATSLASVAGTTAMTLGWLGLAGGIIAAVWALKEYGTAEERARRGRQALADDPFVQGSRDPNDRYENVEDAVSRRVTMGSGLGAGATPTVTETPLPKGLDLKTLMNGIDLTTDGKTKKGSGSKDPTPFEVAKAKWQTDTDELGMSNAKKLELYKADLENVQKTAKEALEYKKDLSKLEFDAAKQSIEDEIAFLELDLAKQNKNSEQGMAERIRIAHEESEIMKKIYGDNSKEYAQAKTKEVQLERQAVEQKVKIQSEINDNKAELAQIDYDIAAENIRAKKELGKISDVEEIAALNALENKKYEIKLKAAQDNLALMKANGLEETENYKKLYAQIELMQKQHNLTLTKQNNQLTAAMRSPWTEFEKSSKDAFEQNLSSVLNWTTSVKNAVRNLTQSVASSMTSMWAKQITQKLFASKKEHAQDQANAAASIAQEQAKQTAITGVQTAGETTRALATKATTAAALASGAAAATAIIGQVSAAFTGTLGMISAMAAAIATIPPGGPAMAAAMMAGVGTATGVLVASSTAATAGISASMGLASYDVGSWSLPSDGPIFAHKEEMVVPAKNGMADTARKFFNGELEPKQQEVQSNDRPANINLTYKATMMDARGIDQVFRRNAKTVTQGLYKVQRSLNKPNQTKWGKTK